MTTLTCIETDIDQNQDHYGCFLIEPLEIGQGVTLGNALRRTLLSELSSYAISGVRINDLKHEFARIEGVREDVLEILLNLKEILFKPSSFSSLNKQFPKFQGFLKAKGPRIITSGMLQIPKNYLTILNPNLYICTLADNSEIYLEIDIEKGKGYKLQEERRVEQLKKSLVFSKFPSTLFVDSLFVPIKKVNFKVKLITDSFGNIKESLTLEVWTNGTVTPTRAVKESCKNLLELISSLFFPSPFFETLKSQQSEL
jgi:DNA-directed RNA polymerase subunit alpha